MLRCPNLACPFRVRHGFPAEFEDSVERCRSCGSALEAAATPAGAQPRPSTAREAWLRLAVTVAVSTAIVGLELANAMTTASPGRLLQPSLVPGLLAVIAATAVADGLATMLRRPSLGTTGTTALAALALAAWSAVRATGGDLAGLELALALLVPLAGLATMLALASLVDRRGLGQGISVIVLGVALGSWLGQLASIAEPGPPLAVGLAGFVLTALWLAHPARARALGRRPLARPSDRASGATPQHASELDRDGDLGLALLVPTGGLVPVALLLVLPELAMNLGLSRLAEQLRAQQHHPLTLLLVLVATAALAWLATRPSRLAQAWGTSFPRADPAALAEQARALFGRALVRNALLALAALLASEWVPLGLIAAAAVVLDLRLELRARLTRSLVATPLALDLVDARARAVATQLGGHFALVQGAHHRALWRSFGRWLPLRLLTEAPPKASASAAQRPAGPES